MKIILAGLAGALLLASHAQAQTVVRVSDFDGPGPYAAMPPRVYTPPPRVYAVPPRDGYAIPAVLPPREVFAILREAGFSPLGAPQQRGLVYTVSAIDRDGEDGRMVIDARSGRILRFMPAYQMGDRMNAEVSELYGPEGGLPPAPDMRRLPPPEVNPKIASRTPTVPLPKRPPVRAVATPPKPVALEKPPVIDKPVAEKPAEPVATPAPAPVQQSAVVEPAPEVKAPEPAATPAPVAEKKDDAPTAAPVVEAKPETPAPAGDKPPPVQGLE